MTKHRTPNLIKSLFLICCLVLNFSSFSQNSIDAEKKILDLFEQLERCAREFKQDSLMFFNQEMEEMLLGMPQQYPDILDYDFPNIPSYFSFCVTSPDRKLRIYSWDTHTGGTMRFYSNVAHWVDNDSVYTQVIPRDEGTPGGFYSQIFKITDELNTFYILTLNSILSSKDCYQAFETVDFESEEIDFQFRKIKTKSGITYKVGFSYDFYSVMDRPERPIKLIDYDAESQTITFPIVNSDGKVSAKKISYQYDGDYLVKIVTAK